MHLTLVHAPRAGRWTGPRVIMDPMATDQQPADIDASVPGSVVEFGAEPGQARPGRRRWSSAGVAAGLATDRRVVPLAALLGAFALFGSLISEWQITTVDASAFGDGEAGNRTVTAGVADLDGWGGGYLAGLFVLVAATVLVLFGPPAGRRYARLVGLSGGGVLLAMIAAIAQSLKGTSRALELVYTLALNNGQIQLSYGRGIWCAVAGVAAVTLALYLAGRYEPAVVAEAAAVETADPLPTVWSWRRPRDEERPPEEPFDLTVTPTTPFTTLTDDHRDKPTGGISG
jgi:hypothetical protein